MHALYDLKDMLCEELKEYGSKEKLDVGGLDIVDKLAHAIKNIDKILEKHEMEESGMGGTYDGSYRRSYESYARGRNARRDSMGRYAREGRSRDYSRADADEMVEDLRELMREAPDQKTRQEFQRFITKLEQM